MTSQLRHRKNQQNESDVPVTTTFGGAVPEIEREEKRELQAPVYSGALVPFSHFFEGVISVLAKAFEYICSTYLPTFLRPAQPVPEISSSTRTCIESFRQSVAQQYDTASAEHERMLLRMYNLTFPDVALETWTAETRRSSKWGSMGFQGKDPASDFRGCGAFGLRVLIYFAESHPHLYRTLMAGKRHREHYPFAITSINLTMVFFEFLGWGMKPKTIAPAAKYKLAQLLFGDADRFDSERTLEAFGELYCAAFVLFDDEWSASNASYMDFPHVIVRVHKKIEQLLLDPRVKSLGDVRSLNRDNERRL